MSFSYRYSIRLHNPEYESTKGQHSILHFYILHSYHVFYHGDIIVNHPCLFSAGSCRGHGGTNGSLIVTRRGCSFSYSTLLNSVATAAQILWPTVLTELSFTYRSISVHSRNLRGIVFERFKLFALFYEF